ncbi:hypothetical protein [Hymenobacter sp. DG25B]|uniref:hypothetical protein n=1 Tax=Hymenobacter sp. DG25B TaxID=1385664 RepID=UPI0012DFEE9D|nr:hypothetical protein [Hymenobacter sp. DG25B]
MKPQQLPVSPQPGVWATPATRGQRVTPTPPAQAPAAYGLHPGTRPATDAEDPNFPTAWVSACEAMGSIF